MNSYSIVVSDSNEESRKKICTLLKKRGYKTYEALDGAETIRICRSTLPDLVIIDTGLRGMNSFEVAHIIEDNKISTVIFITNNINDTFYKNLKDMNVFAYLMKPINLQQLYHTVEFSIMNSYKMSMLSKEIERLENTLEERKIIAKAKGILMNKLNISEEEAFKMLRTKSMNKCISMSSLCKIIIKKYG
ncbi:ANTAR domain-containing response regulator [Clostridium oceanicum]|uniref:Stage 0 sporulation protein A homolog n=1 Tax=Clostridium oceanicum TaxID=1543 RepID=A0ABP3UJN2_9CLOT